MKNKILISLFVFFVSCSYAGAITTQEYIQRQVNHYQTFDVVAKKPKSNSLDNARNNKLTNEDASSAAAKGLDHGGTKASNITGIPESSLEGKEEGSGELLAKKLRSTSIEEAANNKALGKPSGYTGAVKGAAKGSLSISDADEEAPDSILESEEHGISNPEENKMDMDDNDSEDSL